MRDEAAASSSSLGEESFEASLGEVGIGGMPEAEVVLVLCFRAIPSFAGDGSLMTGVCSTSCVVALWSSHSSSSGPKGFAAGGGS